MEVRSGRENVPSIPSNRRGRVVSGAWDCLFGRSLDRLKFHSGRNSGWILAESDRIDFEDGFTAVEREREREREREKDAGFGKRRFFFLLLINDKTLKFYFFFLLIL